MQKGQAVATISASDSKTSSVLSINTSLSPFSGPSCRQHHLSPHGRQ